MASTSTRPPASERTVAPSEAWSTTRPVASSGTKRRTWFDDTA
jgi:hypothetical protein